jgi:hypothetical protein
MRLPKWVLLSSMQIACLVSLGAAWLCAPCAAQPVMEPDYRAALEWWRELPKK